MNPFVIKQLEYFGFTHKPWDNQNFHGLICYNAQSKNEFTLVYVNCYTFLNPQLHESFKTFNFSTQHVITVIEVDQRVEELVHLLERLQDDSRFIYIVYDLNDEVEYFMKDLWNALIMIHQTNV